MDHAVSAAITFSKALEAACKMQWLEKVLLSKAQLSGATTKQCQHVIRNH